MRSRMDYIVTKDQVQGYTQAWPSPASKLTYAGPKCTASTIDQVLLIAGARVLSIFAGNDLRGLQLVPAQMSGQR